MNKPKLSNKQGGELTFSDFVAHPIWGFADDDGDEVMPVDYPGHLIASDGGNAWFIACEFILNDGTKLPGVIYVRTTDHSIYMLVFSESDGRFFDFPVNSMMEGRVAPEELALHLRKTVDQVFPITYVTPYAFRDGQKLIGQFNLPLHKK
jgi:hypothetical protein